MNPIIRQVLCEGRLVLFESEAKDLCAQYNIPVPNYRVALTPEEAIKTAREIGYPIAMKILSKDIIHKSDAGCVVLGVSNDEDVEKAFRLIVNNAVKFNPNAEIKGVLIEEMLPKGIEVAIGAIRDAEFGPTIMFGLGGVFIEVMRDVTFRVAPITRSEAEEMIKDIKGYKILEGYRGQEPADIESILKMILGVSRLIVENDEISQLDLNPVIVWKKGGKVADAKIMLSQKIRKSLTT
ncbi:MAG: acetate--CoA ligase family protein [Candidatus Bathyarchaeia archaeon]